MDSTLLKRVWDLTIHETRAILITRPITNGYHLCCSCKVACFIFPTLFSKILKMEKLRSISTDFKVLFIYYVSTCRWWRWVRKILLLFSTDKSWFKKILGVTKIFFKSRFFLIANTRNNHKKLLSFKQWKWLLISNGFIQKF